MQRTRQLAVNVMLAIVSIAICILLTEFTLRLVFDDFKAELSIPGVRFDSGKNFAERSTRTENLVVHKANNVFTIPRPDGTGSDYYKANSVRLRGPETSLKKPKDTTRILMIGDSVTFGLFIPNEKQTFPRLLEKQLADSLPEQRIEVLNGGFSGYQVEQYYDFYRHYGREFESDLVVVNLVPYDCAKKTLLKSKRYSHFRFAQDDGNFVPSIFPMPSFLEERLIRHSALYRGLNFQLFQYTQKLAPAENQLFYSNYDSCLKTLHNLLEEIKSDGADSFFVIHPLLPWSTWGAEAGDDTTEQRLQLLFKLAEELNVDYVDLRKRYKREGLEPSELRYDIIHPNERGNEIIADALHEKLLEKSFLKRAQ